MGKLANFRLTLNMSEGSESEDGVGLAIAEAKPQLKQPQLYQVVMLDDDYTPMEFVVEVLEMFFYMNREKATQIMLAVHTEGRAVCGVFSRDIAETKASQVNEFSKLNLHPLLCQIEAAE